MSSYALPALFALFVWWFSTGVIIFLDGLPRRTFRWSMLGATLLLAVSFYGLAVTSGDASVGGAYRAFTWGLLAWGWQEISFYMGFVTGPRKEPCPENCGGWKHFLHAIQTSLWHELAIIAAAVIVLALTWKQPNQVGVWTFMILWWMHQSAKLNVFLGVRNLNEEFLPAHLQFLRSFLTKRPMNLLFPVSITLSTIVAVLLAARAGAADATAFQRVGFTFLATMMALAIVEHWFLVLPLPAAKLWQWGLASRRPTQAFDAEIVAGFLGAGKTTLMRRLLAASDPASRTVVLVNDFASVGLDGSLLEGQGADVVELPNGCICCSLRDDLSRQLQEMIARWAPRRVLIEPSGVADVAALVGVLGQPALRPLVGNLKLRAVIDASVFLRDYARLPTYFEAQARLAGELIINKVDLVSAAELRLIAATLRELNPQTAMTFTAFGLPQDDLTARFAREMQVTRAADADAEHAAHAAHAHPHEHHHHDHAEDALGFNAWTSCLDGRCDPQELEDVLAAVARGSFGQIERVKGIARAGDGWIHFDLAGGRPRISAFAPTRDEQARVVVIGRAVDGTKLGAAFAACAAATA